MRRDKQARRTIPILWRKLIPGLILVCIGLGLGTIYLDDNTNMLAGVVAAVIIASGGLLSIQSIKKEGAGFSFGHKKYTGNENTIIWFAKRNIKKSKDIPVILRFAELKHIPVGARLHYLRNFKKHYYELFNNTVEKRLESVSLPDKKAFPPGLFKIPATMQTYKDAMDYSPPTMFQKLAPGIILLAMGLVGLLMVITGG